MLVLQEIFDSIIEWTQCSTLFLPEKETRTDTFHRGFIPQFKLLHDGSGQITIKEI